MTAPWTETTLPTILSRYSLEKIFNVDEFGLFYQCLPGGSTFRKIGLTGLTGNTYGERLQMFVIKTSVKPRCFKGLKTLLCRYCTQDKSWMSGEVFKD